MLKEAAKLEPYLRLEDQAHYSCCNCFYATVEDVWRLTLTFDLLPLLNIRALVYHEQIKQHCVRERISPISELYSTWLTKYFRWHRHLMLTTVTCINIFAYGSNMYIKEADQIIESVLSKTLAIVLVITLDPHINLFMATSLWLQV